MVISAIAWYLSSCERLGELFTNLRGHFAKLGPKQELFFLFARSNGSVTFGVLAAGEFGLEGVGLVFELLERPDLGAVVSPDDGLLDQAEQLDAVADPRVVARVGKEPQHFVLLRGSEGDEGTPKVRQAVAVQPAESLEVLLLFFGGFDAEQEVNEPVRASGLGAGRVSLRDDEVGENDHSLILVLVKKFRFPICGAQRRIGRLRRAQGGSFRHRRVRHGGGRLCRGGSQGRQGGRGPGHHATQRLPPAYRALAMAILQVSALPFRPMAKE